MKHPIRLIVLLILSFSYLVPFASAQHQEPDFSQLDSLWQHQLPEFQASNNHATPFLSASSYLDVAPVAELWPRTPWSDPVRNFAGLLYPYGVAGDVNGDGFTDFFTRIGTPDDRTPEPEDGVTKTFLYYGGPDYGEDNVDVFYGSYHPVGDLNGDGYADGILVDGTDTSFLLGSPTGPQKQSGIVLNSQVSSLLTNSTLFFSSTSSTINRIYLVDIDGDGFDDVLRHNRNLSPSTIEVVFGKQDLNELTIEEFALPFPPSSVSQRYFLNVQMVDGQLYIFMNRASSLVIFRFNSELNIIELVQTIPSISLSMSLSISSKAYIDDFTGDGTLDLWTSMPNMLFERDGDGPLSFKNTPIVLTNGFETYAGDVNGDGRGDFVWIKLSETLSGRKDIHFGNLNAETKAFESVQHFMVPDYTGTLYTTVYQDGTAEGSDKVKFDYSFDSKSHAAFLQRHEDNGIEVTTIVSSEPGDKSTGAMQPPVALGDISGDGIDDFAVVVYEVLVGNQVEIHFGGPGFQTTKTIIPFSRQKEVVAISSGHFVNQDRMDIAISYRDFEDEVYGHSNLGGKYNSYVDFYEGGESINTTPYHRIDLTDVIPESVANEGWYKLDIATSVGDVTHDGFDDFVISLEIHEEYWSKIWFFEGGPAFGQTPPQIIELGDFENKELRAAGNTIRGLGDVNGDGIGDFAVAAIHRQFGDFPNLFFPNDFERSIQLDNNKVGAVYVFFGQDGTEGPVDFSLPNVALLPDTTFNKIEDSAYDGFGLGGIFSGDFNGDGIMDIGVKPTLHLQLPSNFQQSEGVDAIHIYFGGETIRSQPDLMIPIPSNATLHPNQYDSERASRSEYALVGSIPDVNGDRIDELLFIGSMERSPNLYTGGLVLNPVKSGIDNVHHRFSSPINHTPLRVFPTGNLGNNNHMQQWPALGDFNGDGRLDLVVAQNDNNYPEHALFFFDAGPRTGSIERDDSQSPSVVSLDQNYPNPFNPRTVIGFQLPVSGEMRLTVYDLLGRRVTVLIDGMMPAGAHSIPFDASNLASGVYVYRLEAGGRLINRKMTVVK